MKWLEKIRSKKPAPIFGQMLFRSGAGDYIWHRARWTFGLGVTGVLFTTVKLLLVKRNMEIAELYPIFALEALGLLMMTSWWGFLDFIRVRIRLENDFGKREKFIRSWFTRSIFLALLIVLTLTILFRELDYLEWPRKNVLVLSLWTVIFRIGAEVVLLFIHSCSFAYRRVFYPPSLSLLTEFGSFLAFVVLWENFGPWSFYFSILFSSIMLVVFNGIYYLKSYRTLRLPQRGLRLSLRSGFSPDTYPGNWKLPLLSALAGVFSRLTLTSIITAVMYAGSVALKRDLLLALPALHFFSSWPRSLYFDLRKHGASPWVHLLRRALHFIAVRVFLFACGFAVCFMALYSLVGYKNFGVLVFLATGPILSLVSFYLMYWLSYVQQSLTVEDQDVTEYPVVHEETLFLALVSRQLRPVRVYRILIGAGERSRRAKDALVRHLAGKGIVWQAYEKEFLWAEWTEEEKTPEWWLTFFGGMLEDFALIADAPNGKQALEEHLRFSDDSESGPPKDLHFPLFKDPSEFRTFSQNLTSSIRKKQGIPFRNGKLTAIYHRGNIVGFRSVP